MNRDDWKKRQAEGIAKAKATGPEKYQGRKKGSTNKAGKVSRPKKVVHSQEAIIAAVSLVRALQEYCVDEFYGRLLTPGYIPPRGMRKYSMQQRQLGFIKPPKNPPLHSLKLMKEYVAKVARIPPSRLYKWIRDNPDVKPAGMALHEIETWWDVILGDDDWMLRKNRLPSEGLRDVEIPWNLSPLDPNL